MKDAFISINKEGHRSCMDVADDFQKGLYMAPTPLLNLLRQYQVMHLLRL